MPKYIVTWKVFSSLFPMKNYNKKTLVFFNYKKKLFFYPGEGVKKNFSWVKKTTAFSSIVSCILYIKSNPHFSQVINQRRLAMIYLQCFHAKTGDYNNHFSSSSLEQVIGNIFQTCRS